MGRDRRDSELYGEVGEGEGREGVARCSAHAVWCRSETGTVEDFFLEKEEILYFRRIYAYNRHIFDKLGGNIMYAAMDLAKYIVSKCTKENVPISNLQLQKILYYIQKEFLHKRGTIAFNDSIEAWQFGPVVPRVYYFFSGAGSMPILMQYNIKIGKDDKKLIDSIVEEKRSLNPWEMVEDTHRPNGAWDSIYRDGRGASDVIPVEMIEERG